MTPYLSLAIWVPIVAGVAVLGVGRDRDAAFARWIALAGAIAGFLVTIPLFTNFDRTTSAMQFVEFVTSPAGQAILSAHGFGPPVP